MPTKENAERAFRALVAFSAPMADLTVDDLAVPGTIFQIGIAPNRVDVVTSIDAVAFEAAWQHRVASRYGDAPIFVLGIEELLINKRAVGRPQARRRAPRGGTAQGLALTHFDDRPASSPLAARACSCTDGDLRRCGSIEAG